MNIFLVTLDPKSLHSINHKVIGGTKSDGITVLQSVAYIDDEAMITVVTGDITTNHRINPSQNSSFNIEILPNGQIISSEIKESSIE